jgi:hypothetical protein
MKALVLIVLCVLLSVSIGVCNDKVISFDEAMKKAWGKDYGKYQKQLRQSIIENKKFAEDYRWSIGMREVERKREERNQKEQCGCSAIGVIIIKCK